MYNSFVTSDSLAAKYEIATVMGKSEEAVIRSDSVLALKVVQ
jgi:hypothetical protein